MSWLINYCLKRKTIYLTILFQVIVFCGHSQCPSAETIYQQVLAIENDAISTTSAKLKKILFLKKQFEDCRLPNDSIYARILHRAGKLEYEANGGVLTTSVINNTQEAARINTSKNKNASEKFGVKSYFNLASYYYNVPYYDKALPYYDSVIYFNRNHADQQEFTIYSLFYKALIYGERRDYEKYAETSTLGLAASKKSGDSFYIAKFYYFRAQGYCNQAIWNIVKQDIDSGFYYATRIHDTSIITDLTGLKALYSASEKDYANAEALFKKTLALRIQKQDKYNLTTDYLAFGNYYLNDRHDLMKAISCYEKLISFCHLPEDNIRLSQAYTVWGEAYFRSGNLQAARQKDSIAATFLTSASPKNFLQNASADQLFLINYKDALLVFMNNKVQLLLYLYNQNHQPNYLQACLQTALIMDTLVTKIRHEQIGEQSKLYWRNKTREFFNNAIEACYLSGNDSLAFYFMEKSRAVLLYDELNERKAAANLPDEEKAKEESYQIRMMEEQQKLSQQIVGSAAYTNAQALLFQTRDDFEQYSRSLENKNSIYYRYKYDDAIISLTDFKRYVAKNNLSFIHYFKTDSTIYVLGITKNKTSFIKIPAANFDTRQLSQFINLCSNKEALMNGYPTYSSLAQTIYQKLFQPLAIPKGNVAICTDNFFIPFEALCTDDKGKNYLLYNYNFSYVYSARSLLKTFTYSAPTGNFIGFAPVSFSPSLQVFDLKNSSDALKTVAGFYSNHTLFTQENATRNNFIKEASHYAVVTIFSHAHADTTDTEPVLYMQDSLVHLSDLQRLNNSSIQFVLLSACQTNIGKNATGEGIYSLARGFASIGVPSVSATLWKADEGAVYEISTKFNEYLAKGMNKSEALQKAKIWYLQTNSDNENSMPFFWANMVLIGNSEPIVLTSANHSWVWVSAIGCLLMIAAFFVFYRKKKGSFQYNEVSRR